MKLNDGKKPKPENRHTKWTKHLNHIHKKLTNALISKQLTEPKQRSQIMIEKEGKTYNSGN